MIQRLINRFVKDPQDVTNLDVREAYAVLAGVMGIVLNVLLFIAKLIIGLSINSIAILSDAFNNLTDLSSSIIVILSTKIGNNPPDREHPHGHGRSEYIGSLIIALIIFMVGLQLGRNSVVKIFNPEIVVLNTVAIVFLVITIAVKLWMFSYNRYIGRLINSDVCRAAAFDSINDAIATSVLLLGILFSKYTSLPIDGIMGLGISGMIIYTGYVIAREAIDSLLGASPDPKLVKQIEKIIKSNKSIIDSHDLKLHDYGPGNLTGSMHVVVPDDANITEIHAEIHVIEEQIKSEVGVDIVLHMDPGVPEKIKKERYE